MLHCSSGAPSRPVPLLFVLLLATALPSPGAAVQSPVPTAAEMDELAAASRGAPLFAVPEPLVMTLRTRIDWLRDERPDEEEADGTITYREADGREVTVDVEVRTRGNFRREKRNCNFPPLRLDLPRSRVDGTVFEGQNRLKLVTPCHDSRDDYQQYVLKEYLAYRLLQLLTPMSYRARLIEVTYEDVDEEYDTRTKTGFLIESDDAMAHRNRATMLEVPQLHPATADAESAWMVSLFEYMIGNVDWSAAFFHNVELVRTEEGRYVSVPYDFDFSGLVNARYAEPPPQVEIRNVRQRAFRGFCRDGIDHAAMRERFLDIRPQVAEVIASIPGMEDDVRKRSAEYLEDFWEIMESEDRYRRRILDECREMPG